MLVGGPDRAVPDLSIHLDLVLVVVRQGRADLNHGDSGVLEMVLLRAPAVCLTRFDQLQHLQASPINPGAAGFIKNDMLELGLHPRQSIIRLAIGKVRPDSVYGHSANLEGEAAEWPNSASVSEELEAEARELMEEVLADAYGEDEQLWSFRQAFEDEVSYPVRGRVGGASLSVLDVDYEGDPRAGLVARCQWPDGSTFGQDVAEIAFSAKSQAARLVAAYRLWLGKPAALSAPAKVKAKAKPKAKARLKDKTAKKAGESLDLERVRARFRSLRKDALLELLDRALTLLPSDQWPILLDGCSHLPQAAPEISLLDETREFVRASQRRDYFDDFEVNSKTWRDVSAGTKNWLRTCERLLTRCAKEAQRETAAETLEAFELLFSLLRYIDDGHDDMIFFADEGGSWQVGVDWVKTLPAYFACLAACSEPDDYACKAEKAIRELDDYHRARLLRSAKRAGTAPQKKALARFGV